MKISVVVPCYNEEATIELLYHELNKVVSEMEYDFEYIFVNDGSKDNTLNVIKKLNEEDDRVKYVSLSRNFGKESALYAGLENTSGDYVVTMDADLQDPPRLLPEMMEYLNRGYDSVATRRVTRKGEPPIRSFFARMFYKFINMMSDVDIVDGARDYRLMTAQMKDAVLSVSEYNRFSKGIFGWVGFQTKWLEYENVERVAGETKWSFWKLFLYSLEGLFAFSTLPLVVASMLGLFFCFIAAIMVVFVFVRALLFGDPVAGWPSLACIIIFLGGTQLFCHGISGQYLTKIYLETKQRPKYIIKETNVEK
mgnify:FL=1